MLGVTCLFYQYLESETTNFRLVATAIIYWQYYYFY